MDATIVKQLRDKTNAGMMDCKKALEEASGDMDKALDILRKKGVATAAKKAGREAKEGVIQSVVLNNGTLGVMVEVNCETDFAARNDNFKILVNDIVDKIAKGSSDCFTDKEIKEEKLEKEVHTLVTDAIGRIGENMSFRRFVRYENQNGMIGTYIHLGGKIGVLVEFEGKKENMDGLIKDISMQIAAAYPEYVDRTEVPVEILTKEKEIFKAQITGKPDNVIEKIVIGKMEKFYEEKCLVDQLFIKEQKTKIKDILGNVKVKRFSRFQLGV